jgi:hypothetical protein
VAELKPAAENEKNRLKAKIQVAADARLGEHSFRVITASGISDVRLFYVSPFPLVEEQKEDKDKPNQPQPVAFGTTVYGRVQNEDQDKFEVEATKGQRISVEIIGARLQTQNIFDTAMAITKPDGTPLVEVDDTAFSRQDPVASVVAPEDGKYIITVRDATNQRPGRVHLPAEHRDIPAATRGLPAGRTSRGGSEVYAPRRCCGCDPTNGEIARPAGPALRALCGRWTAGTATELHPRLAFHEHPRSRAKQ